MRMLDLLLVLNDLKTLTFFRGQVDLYHFTEKPSSSIFSSSTGRRKKYIGFEEAGLSMIAFFPCDVDVTS